MIFKLLILFICMESLKVVLLLHRLLMIGNLSLIVTLVLIEFVCEVEGTGRSKSNRPIIKVLILKPKRSWWCLTLKCKLILAGVHLDILKFIIPRCFWMIWLGVSMLRSLLSLDMFWLIFWLTMVLGLVLRDMMLRKLSSKSDSLFGNFTSC